MRVSQFFSTFTAALFSIGRTQAKHVFSHYMVGTVTEAHAQKDIDDARAMGVSFLQDSLNAADSQAGWFCPQHRRCYQALRQRCTEIFVLLC